MATTAKQKKEIARIKEQELAAVAMYSDDEQAGFEDADKDAYAIPFINILQSNSPQCNKADGAYIEGAESGFIFNTVAEHVLEGKDSILVIPCHYQRVFIEWKDRDSGGGFVAEHSVEDAMDLLKQCHKDDKNKDVLPNGNIIVDTRNHFVLVQDMGAWKMTVISMTSTQLKKSRKWMSKMQDLKMRRGDGSSFTPPMFSHAYKLETVPESNDKGSWFGWKITMGGLLTDKGTYDEAKRFRTAINSGAVKAQPPTEDGMGEEREDF